MVPKGNRSPEVRPEASVCWVVAEPHKSPPRAGDPAGTPRARQVFRPDGKVRAASLRFARNASEFACDELALG